MHTTTIIRFDEADVINWPVCLDAAFNRVSNFTPELEFNSKGAQTRERVLWNKIVNNREFSVEDWHHFVAYASEVVRRITERIKEPHYKTAPFIDMRPAVKQARDNLVDVMTRLSEEINQLL